MIEPSGAGQTIFDLTRGTTETAVQSSISKDVTSRMYIGVIDVVSDATDNAAQQAVDDSITNEIYKVTQPSEVFTSLSSNVDNIVAQALEVNEAQGLVFEVMYRDTPEDSYSSVYGVQVDGSIDREMHR